MRDAAFRVRRAASSGQRTTSAQHGTDDTHKMQHTTIPPLPQQAPNTNGTDNTQQAMQCNEMRRTKSGRSRTSGHAAPAVVESDGVLDSDCRRVTVTVESCNSPNWAFGDGGTDPAKSDVPNSQDQSGRQGESETEASETSESRRSEGA